MAVNRVVLQHMSMNLLEEFPGYDLNGVLPEQREEDEEEEENIDGDDSPNIQVIIYNKPGLGLTHVKIIYSNHLNTRLVQYSNSRFVSGCQMVQYSNCGLKTGLKKPVYVPKCLAFEWSTKSRDCVI